VLLFFYLIYAAFNNNSSFMPIYILKCSDLGKKIFINLTNRLPLNGPKTAFLVFCLFSPLFVYSGIQGE
jgi:hypothetical protein